MTLEEELAKHRTKGAKVPTLWDTVATDVGALMEVQSLGEWDLEEGLRLRDENLTKVKAHADQLYRDRFETVVRDFCAQRRDWTSEDVTARIGQPLSHPNAVGALTRSVAVQFGATKVGRVKAQRSNQHATEIAVWGWR